MKKEEEAHNKEDEPRREVETCTRGPYNEDKLYEDKKNSGTERNCGNDGGVIEKDGKEKTEVCRQKR